MPDLAATIASGSYRRADPCPGRARQN